MARRPLVAGGLVLAILTLVDAPSPVRLMPGLRLRKTVSVDGACPGVDRVSVRAATSVTYCYTVTNTGSMLARDIVVTDAGRSVHIGALAGGQSRTVTRTIVVSPTSHPATDDADATASLADATAGTTAELGPFSTVITAAETGCTGVEVATIMSGRALTACYTLAKPDEAGLADASAVDGQAGAPVASAPLAPSVARGSIFALGAASAIATTLQSP